MLLAVRRGRAVTLVQKDVMVRSFRWCPVQVKVVRRSTENQVARNGGQEEDVRAGHSRGFLDVAQLDAHGGFNPQGERRIQSGSDGSFIPVDRAVKGRADKARHPRLGFQPHGIGPAEVHIDQRQLAEPLDILQGSFRPFFRVQQIFDRFGQMIVKGPKVLHGFHQGPMEESFRVLFVRPVGGDVHSVHQGLNWSTCRAFRLIPGRNRGSDQLRKEGFQSMAVHFEFQQVEIHGAQVKIEAAVEFLGQMVGRFPRKGFQAEVSGQDSPARLVGPDVVGRFGEGFFRDGLGQLEDLLSLEGQLLKEPQGRLEGGQSVQSRKDERGDVLVWLKPRPDRHGLPDVIRRAAEHQERKGAKPDLVILGWIGVDGVKDPDGLLVPVMGQFV